MDRSLITRFENGLCISHNIYDYPCFSQVCLIYEGASDEVRWSDILHRSKRLPYHPNLARPLQTHICQDSKCPSIPSRIVDCSTRERIYSTSEVSANKSITKQPRCVFVTYPKGVTTLSSILKGAAPEHIHVLGRFLCHVVYQFLTAWTSLGQADLSCSLAEVARGDIQLDVHLRPVLGHLPSLRGKKVRPRHI